MATLTEKLTDWAKARLGIADLLKRVCALETSPGSKGDDARIRSGFSTAMTDMERKAMNMFVDRGEGKDEE